MSHGHEAWNVQFELAIDTLQNRGMKLGDIKWPDVLGLMPEWALRFPDIQPNTARDEVREHMDAELSRRALFAAFEVKP
jgi:hypothetical protein